MGTHFTQTCAAAALLLLSGCQGASTSSVNPGKTGGYHLVATTNDGTGSFDSAAQSSITVTGELYMISISSLELSSPGRQFNITAYTTGDPTGQTLSFEMPAGVASGGYGRSLGSDPGTYSTALSGGTGTVTFNSCIPGSNTAKGTFSFTAVRTPPGTGTVTVTNGTFGD
jgi:hypothetical protein